MRVGFALPQFGAAADEPGGVARFASTLERAGAGGFWAGDRLFAPVEPVIGYGGTDTMPEQFHRTQDPFIALAAAAAVTSTAVLGSSTINATFYPPALLARTLTTLDVASGGRLRPGFGIGWSPDEYEAIGVPFAGRGDRLDDLLDLLDAWWTQNPVAHKGSGYTVVPSHVALKPVSTPRPPLYLAGYSARAQTRVARRADGWLPVWSVPNRLSVERLTGMLAGIREQAEQAGRAPESISVALRVNVAAGEEPATIARELVHAATALDAADAFVDLTYLAESVEQMIDLAGQVLDKVNAG
ncbi:MAG TPA: TIGR03619 family F420-dependent LLM class oxidoreductase [Pseudonocardiaceae bacterium]|jgi:probable F420-dependent oxidoreductase|nr:TIGR03619 family F420-dependent LLM class oxidoreductase [Pseudonocardiaceae bacterium]